MKGNIKITYQEKDLKLARFAKVLGHPARIAILRHLSIIYFINDQFSLLKVETQK